MKYDINKEKATVTLTFEFEPAEVNRSRRNVYKDYQKHLNINGFRRGKVPYQMAKQLLGKDFLDSPLAESMVNNELKELLDKEELEPLTQIDITNFDYGDDGSLKVEVAFAVEPVVEVGNIIQKLEELEVSESLDESDEKKEELKNKEIDRILIELADKNDKDSPIEEDDYVTLSVHSTDVDKPVPDELVLVVGNDNFFLPGQVTETLIGKEAGDNLTLTDNEDTYDVTVESVQTFTKPELTEEYVKDNFLYDSLEEFEEQMENIAMINEINRVSQKIGKELLDQVINDADVEFSPLFIDDLKENKNEQLIEAIKISYPDLVVEDDIQTLLNFQKQFEVVTKLINYLQLQPTQEDSLMFYLLNSKTVKPEELNTIADDYTRIISHNDFLTDKLVESFGQYKVAIQRDKKNEESQTKND